MRPLLAVFAGGLVGTSLRLTLDLALPHGPTEFPFSTLIINLVGAFVLAVLVARLWPVAPAWARAGLGTGVLGSFTTFSALTVAIVTLSNDGRWMLALLYLAVSMVGGLAAAWLGLHVGRGPRARPDLVSE